MTLPPAEVLQEDEHEPGGVLICRMALAAPVLLAAIAVLIWRW